jgi:rhodanese-related sulfurtransferase
VPLCSFRWSWRTLCLGIGLDLCSCHLLHTKSRTKSTRETYEWNSDHIPLAQYTGRGMLERDVERLIPDPADMVVVYCAGGVRSILAARALQEMGYTNVHSLAGGMKAWKDANLPVVKNQRVFSDQASY